MKFIQLNFLLVYLQTSPQIAYDRIKKRGRSEENGIQMSFLDNLNRLHEDWFINRNSTAAKTIPAKKYVFDLMYLILST